MQYFRKGLSGKTQMAGELRNRGLQTGNHLFKQDFARMWGGMHFHGDLRSVVIQIIDQFDILIQVGRIIWEGIEAGMERAKRSIQWYLG